MPSAIEDEVRNRAAFRCEYCRVPESAFRLSFEIDHITAKQHGGVTALENLALCCPRCNRNKGPNVGGIDPESGSLTRLFHPRKDRWQDHFRWSGALLEALTGVGRTTVYVLAINDPMRVALRESLIAEHIFPPEGIS